MTASSLVIIDELGRGTSTEDGFGIAWAVLERLAQSRAVVLFATHFHELSSMEGSVDGTQNLSVNALVPSDGDNIVMQYKIQSGPCDKSYGIDVAKLMKFPSEIIENAYEFSRILDAL